MVIRPLLVFAMGTFLPVTGPKDFAVALSWRWICLGYSVQAAVGSMGERPVPGDDRCAINGLAGLTGSCARGDGAPKCSIVFGDYALDPDRRELTRHAEAVAIGPKVFDLLLYLVQNREHVVSKDDLLDAVWAGRIVSESTLTSHINAVRKAIGDSGEEQRLVRTLARKGFRFVGDVREAPDDRASPGASTAKPDEASAPALILPDSPSIAALPFQNWSGDPEQEYFADGVVEDIITALSRIRWLFVIARNSSFTYKGRAVDVKQVGRELGVRYVLEGSVRKAANRVRITGQLIDATTGAHLWADRFEGTLDDIFELQDQVADAASSARSRHSSSAPRSSAPCASRPKASMPTTTICAAWQISIREPGRPSTRRCRSSTGRSSSIRVSHRPMAWRRRATIGAK